MWFLGRKTPEGLERICRGYDLVFTSFLAFVEQLRPFDGVYMENLLPLGSQASFARAEGA